jgi:hypothetical protein
VTVSEMSFLRPPKANSRQHLIEKRLIGAAILLAVLMIGFFAVSFGKFGMLCFYGLVLIGVVFELIKGMRLILRVLTNWLPGLTIATARFEGWLDAEIAHD